MIHNVIYMDSSSQDTLRFDGRVALVTGGGRGLGRAYAHLLASRGAAVVVNDLGAAVDGTGADKGPAVEVAREIVASGGQAVADVGDVAEPEAAQRMVELALERFGQLDIVVNNAGINAPADIIAADPQQLQRHLDVHLLGSFNVTKAAWPALCDQRFGRVIITASSAIFGIKTLIPYSSAKAGLVGLGRSLAAAGRGHGITVNIVAPYALTRIQDRSVDRRAAGLPDLPGEGPDESPPTPEQAACLVAFLAHESSTTSGEIYRVIGNRVARVFLAETRGYRAPSLTPERIRDHWQEINDEDGYFVPADSAELMAWVQSLERDYLSELAGFPAGGAPA
jgi:NAD(P)-dependent dehydrogenase (short-subunit alcohol dehydrogenase family)